MDIREQNCVERFKKLILSELSEQKITCWIVGGAVRDYFSGIPIKTDIDVFFPDSTQFELCKNYLKSKGAELLWESENGEKYRYNGKTYDLVKKYFQTPTESIEAFDFTVSQFAVDVNKVYMGEFSMMDLAKRQLMINKITYPASTLSRAFRYYKKGFTMCSGEMKKLYESIQSDKPVQDILIQPEAQTSEMIPPSGDYSGFFSGID